MHKQSAQCIVWLASTQHDEELGLFLLSVDAHSFALWIALISHILVWFDLGRNHGFVEGPTLGGFLAAPAAAAATAADLGGFQDLI